MKLVSIFLLHAYPAAEAAGIPQLEEAGILP